MFSKYFSRPLHFWLLAAAFVVFLLLRLPKLFQVPMFVDEGFHMHWLLEFARGQFGTPIRDGKFLYIVLIYPSLWFSQPLIAARIVSLIVGFAGVGAMFLAARRAFDARTGAIAAMLYAVSPILVLHDLMIMQEGLVALFGSLVLWSSLRFAREPSLARSLWLNLFIAGGMLSKLPALYYAAIPLVAFFSTGGRDRFRQWLGRLAAFSWIPAGTLAFLIAAGWGVTQKDKVVNIRYFHSFLMVSHWVVTYLTWPCALLFAFALTLALYRRQRLIYSLFAYSVLPLLIWPAFFSPLYPRYFILTLPFMFLCIAWALNDCLRRLNRGAFAVGLLVMAPLLWNDYWLWSDWEGRRMPEMDKWQYGTGWPAGYAIDAAVDFLRKTNSGPYFVAGDITTMMRIDWLLRDPRAQTVWLDTAFTLEWERMKANAGAVPAFLVFNEPLLNQKTVLGVSQHADLAAAFKRPGGKSRVLVYRLRRSGNSAGPDNAHPPGSAEAKSAEDLTAAPML